MGHHKIRAVAASFALAAFVFITAAPTLATSQPNPNLTPGATDPRVTQATIGTTICTRGYTSTVRNVSTRTKHAVYVAYGIAKSQQRGYVIDHLIPLEVGGANDATNLWPEPKADAKAKDQLENQMHAAVCAGPISLADAQARFVTAAPGSVPTSSTTVTVTITLPAPTVPTPPVPTPAPETPKVVHPGAFCAPAGARGVTSAGTPMVCGPASDGRNRWRSG